MDCNLFLLSTSFTQGFTVGLIFGAFLIWCLMER